MTHPLTDEMIDEIQMRHGGPCFECYDDLRAAADWQLDRCTEELNGILSLFQLAGKIDEADRVGLLKVFKNAMRPQEGK